MSDDASILVSMHGMRDGLTGTAKLAEQTPRQTVLTLPCVCTLGRVRELVLLNQRPESEKPMPKAPKNP